MFAEKSGSTDLIYHTTELNDHTPCWQKPYTIPLSMRDAVESELNSMLQARILQYDPGTKYNSPLIIVRKKNNEIRLVNNYIELNKKTTTDKYPMANANKLLSRAAGSKYITILDLFHYFWQIPLTPESRKYTGFHTPFGSYSYVMTQMGLSGAPMTAQRLIDRVLKGAHK